MAFPLGSHAAELQASDGAQYDSFGISVATLGGYALIGAENSGTGSGSYQGSAYLFRNLDNATGTITQNATLVASDRKSGDFFGRVSIYGDIAIVGSFANTIGSNHGQGAAYLFRNLSTASGTIIQNAKLLASDGGEISSFGGSVSMWGTNGLIGADGNRVGINSGQGSAYLFRNLDTVTGTVTQNVKLIASDGKAGDSFGRAVSFSDENALVGATGVRSGDGRLNRGAAYFFGNLAVSGTTATETVKLFASDGVEGDYFGNAVSLNGDIALIGAPFAEVGSSRHQGAAYLFRDLYSATGTVTQQVKLIASETSSGGLGAFFGSSVSLVGDRALVGARSDSSQGNGSLGAVYIFSDLYNATGVVTESVKISATDAKANDSFGSSVDLDGTRFVIGASNADGASADTGKAYLGTLNSFMTLERALSEVIDGLSFVSRTDWIIGKFTGGNTMTLSAGDNANVTGTGMGVYIGQHSGSSFNQLTISGSLVTNAVRIGSQASSVGNNLTIAENGLVETGFIRGAPGGTPYDENSLKIDGGTIRFTESGTGIRDVQKGEVLILDDGATFDTQDNNIAIGAAMIGTGGLTKLGSGSLDLRGANTYTGITTVSEGTLLLGHSSKKASIAGGVVISKFGELHGNGKIRSQLINHGGLAPGRSAGTLEIGGGFVQTSTGTLEMEITGEGNDQLIVGSDTVLGGTLELTSDGTPLAFGQRINLILGSEPITGEFESIRASGFGDVREIVKVIGNSAILIIAPQSYAQAATTSNEINVATALDSWIDDGPGDTTSVSESLDQLTAAEYQQAFATISPTLYSAALATAIEQSQSQSSVLTQHLTSRRLRQSPTTDKNWEAWALSSGLYSPGSMSSFAGDDFSSGNFLSGIEHQLNATFSAGLFSGFGDSEGDFSGASEIEQERLTLGAYATATRDGFYANSALGFGILEMDVTRSIQFSGLSREAHSSTDGTEFFGLISGGYDFRQADWTFGPTGSLQYSKIRYDDVKERGAGALGLAVDHPEDDSLRSQIGGRVAYHYKASEQLTLIPEARIFWQHEFLRDSEILHATLEQGSGANFAHQISDFDGDSVLGGVALGFQTNFGLYGNVSYDIEIGRESDLNHTLSVGADWRF